MLRRLVEDFGYPKDHIKSRPQHRVRKSPSDESGTYPVDIAVFESPAKVEGELRLVVECKRPKRKEGLEQLKLYMEMSAASVGVWFNGQDHLYLRKIVSPGGERSFVEIPSIPRFGQSIDDMGKQLRRDLMPASNLKAVFGDLRNHLAGNVVGITREVALAEQMLNIVFCKLYDERYTAREDVVSFRAGAQETAEEIAQRVNGLFDRVKDQYTDVFAEDHRLAIDSTSLAYVVGELQNYSLMGSSRDAVADAFEVFVGPALRGTEGQFFTPRNVVQMVVEMLDPKPEESIIDPACGSGGFLIQALDAVWARLSERAPEQVWDDQTLLEERNKVAGRLRGIDKDTFLTKVTKAYMAIMGDGRGGIFCENSLAAVDTWSDKSREHVRLGTFDIVVTNPPFGSKIKINDADIISQYELGHKWKSDPETQEFALTESAYVQRPPQILFLERCVKLLKPGGRLGIVLPESMVGNPSYRHVMQWFAKNMHLQAVVAMPEPLFKTSGKGGTHTKVCVVVATRRDATDDSSTTARRLFMSDVRWCGHDSRGNPTERMVDGERVLLDEVPEVAGLYRRHAASEKLPSARLAHQIMHSDVRSDIYVPKYYDPRLPVRAAELERTHLLLGIGDLVESGHVDIASGVEPGKMSYGTGTIPFIRTSDISNWELKADPKHSVSEDVYRAFSSKCEVEVGDILLVRDGTYLIGTSAMITKADSERRLLFQSHILRLRLLKPLAVAESDHPEDTTAHAYLLFAALNSEFVSQQVRAFQFTQDIIDTLGQRVKELQLPVPRDSNERRRIADKTQRIVEGRSRLRSDAASLAQTMAAGYEDEATHSSSIR
ncbi:N-6 DNA methylase [Candidatus Poriferisodalis sp.]|uniref:N-6 DNA methylase n=1 Tax=Candidatus Poriferisodalis sp. TaxID=3101277 RepID=UPI003B0188F6